MIATGETFLKVLQVLHDSKTFQQSKDDVDEILSEMPSTLVRDVMQKRLKVTKEPAPAATPKK